MYTMYFTVTSNKLLQWKINWWYPGDLQSVVNHVQEPLKLGAGVLVVIIGIEEQLDKGSVFTFGSCNLTI